MDAKNFAGKMPRGSEIFGNSKIKFKNKKRHEK